MWRGGGAVPGLLPEEQVPEATRPRSQGLREEMDLMRVEMNQ